MFYGRLTLEEINSSMVRNVTDLDNHFDFDALDYNEETREFRTWPDENGEFKRFPIATFNTSMLVYTTDEWKNMVYEMSCEIEAMLDHEARQTGVESLLKQDCLTFNDVNRLQISYARRAACHFKSIYAMRKLLDRFTEYDVRQACILWCILTDHTEKLFIDPSDVDWYMDKYFC